MAEHSNINLNNSFLDLPPKLKEIKAKLNKLDLTKRKSFCTTKETINKMKIQPTEWEKLFANDMPDKGLIANIYKQLVQLKIKETNNLIKNGQKN